MEAEIELLSSVPYGQGASNYEVGEDENHQYENPIPLLTSRVRQTPEEGRGTYRPKLCGNNNKDKDNSPKTLNDKNHQALSLKFKQ